jgi:hypothetical protein
MARFRDEESRLAYFVKKYGEDDGRRRYDDLVAKESGDPMPLQGSPNTGERAPRRRSRKPNPQEVYTATASAIYMLDTGACWLLPVWQEDRLTAEEIGRLGVALGDEILSSEYLISLLTKAQKNSVHIKLAYTLASIALPRMVKHGMIPAALAAQVGENDAETDAASVPVESGSAHGDRGDDGLGEIHFGSASTERAEVPAGAAEQGRSGYVSTDTGERVVFGNGRPSGVPPGFASEVREAT